VEEVLAEVASTNKKVCFPMVSATYLYMQGLRYGRAPTRQVFQTIGELLDFLGLAQVSTESLWVELGEG
jgi:hypothetical protein